MSIQIHVPTPMRPHADNRAVVDVEGTTVQGVLNELGKRYPALRQRLFENGQVRRFVNIYLNDEDIRYLDNLDTGVKDGDSLSIVPAVAGG
jgi:molybdopterin synthase sulfur carrier subunit